MVILLPLCRLLQILLEAPTIIEGLCSPEGLNIATVVAERISQVGGIIFLETYAWPRQLDDALEGLGRYMSWGHMVLKASAKFIQRT
jgi:hypothetical protein